MTNAEISIIIAREDDGWPPEEALLALAEKIINTARLDLNLSVPKPVELSLVFAGDAMVKTLNAQWRGKDKPTNVLSFPSFVMKPGQQLPTMLGDIVLARETVCREAEAEGKSMENHVAHLLLHGFLHLLGYDHENEAEALEMELIETRILGQLAIPDPYAVIAYPS